MSEPRLWGASRRRRPPLWLQAFRLALFALITMAIMFISGFTYLEVRTYSAPAPRRIYRETPNDWNLAYSDITFVGDDGLHLSGWYIPSENGAAVILVHGGANGNRLSTGWYATRLAEEGFGVLLYDRRANGQSEGKRNSWGWLDVRDVPGAVRFLKRQPNVDRIGIFGCSIGGQIALRAAAELEDIAAVIADAPSLARIEDAGPPLDFGDRFFVHPYNWLFDRVWAWYLGTPLPSGVLDAIDDIAPRPVMIVSSGDDPREKQYVRLFYERAHEPKVFWDISDAGHCLGPLRYPYSYAARMNNFFREHLVGGQLAAR